MRRLYTVLIILSSLSAGIVVALQNIRKRFRKYATVILYDR